MTPISIEAEILQILEAPVLAGESVQQSFDAKERAVHGLIDTLTLEVCAKLHTALANDDHANILRRLSAERRRRVLDHLQLAARPRRCA